MDALKEKYCDDGDDNFGNIVVVFARPRKQSGSSDGDGGGAELGYLTNMVSFGGGGVTIRTIRSLFTCYDLPIQLFNANVEVINNPQT